LPAGTWTHLLTGEVRNGGRWYQDELDFFSVPLWIRQGALLCVGSTDDEVDYDSSQGLRLICGKLDGRISIEVRLIDAQGGKAGRLELYHDQQRIRVKSATLSDFQVHLPWAASVEIERGSLVRDDARSPLTTRGVVVRADGGTVSLKYVSEAFQG
jgi:alpha-D-xyloside xylohydrolase